MIIIFFILIFGGVWINEYRNRDIPCIIKNEKSLRHELYQVYKNHPHFYKASSCKFSQNIDLYITILQDHIQKVQKKIIKPHGFFKSKSVRIGCGLFGLSIASALRSYWVFTHYLHPNEQDYIEYINIEKIDPSLRKFLDNHAVRNISYIKINRTNDYADDALNYTINTIDLPIISCACATMALRFFYKFVTSARRQPNCLQRDKELLTLFKMKKDKQNNN